MDINSTESSGVSPTTIKGRTANEIARELIARSHAKASNVSFVYRELLRSVINTFSGFVVIDSEEKVIDVQAIHATQERAIAKLTEETNLILPIISVDQPKSSRTDSRQKYKPLVVTEKYWDEKKQRSVRLISLVPSPIEIEYEVSVWAKYKNDLDQITEQLHSLFNPDLELVTAFATNIKLFISDEVLDSNLVVSDREDRVLKRIFKLRASTYIPSPKFLMTSTGAIEDFHIEYELGTETVIQTVNNLRVRQGGGETISQVAQSNYVSYGSVIFKLPYIDTNGNSGLTEMPGELARPT